MKNGVNNEKQKCCIYNFVQCMYVCLYIEIAVEIDWNVRIVQAA